MELEKIKDEKIFLEAKIGQLIADFEADTGTLVGETLKVKRGEDKNRPGEITIGLKVMIP
jgi:hypothetical protein